jgi:hypothetical protein
MTTNPPPPFDADAARRLCEIIQSYTLGHAPRFGTTQQEEDAATLLRAAVAEVERLTECLKRANGNHEHFERLWYLEKDQSDQLRERVKELEQR